MLNTYFPPVGALPAGVTSVVPVPSSYVISDNSTKGLSIISKLLFSFLVVTEPSKVIDLFSPALKYKDVLSWIRISLYETFSSDTVISPVELSRVIAATLLFVNNTLFDFATI